MSGPTPDDRLNRWLRVSAMIDDGEASLAAYNETRRKAVDLLEKLRKERDALEETLDIG